MLTASSGATALLQWPRTMFGIVEPVSYASAVIVALSVGFSAVFILIKFDRLAEFRSLSVHS